MSGPLRLPDWDQLSVAVPAVVATMRRYLDQLASILRPGSVGGADQALRSLAAFLVDHAPDVTSVGQLNRRHLEDFRQWLAARPGRNTVRMNPATLAHRLGTRPRTAAIRAFGLSVQESLTGAVGRYAPLWMIEQSHALNGPYSDGLELFS